MVDLILWIMAGLLAGAAAWMTLPRQVALDWEIYFKLGLVTLIRGELQAEDKGRDDWLARGRALAWYHPGARDLERKLIDPAGYEIPVPARAGELALQEALKALPDPAARLKKVFEGGATDEALYDDPEGFGEEYDVRRVLGMGADWEQVAGWSPVTIEGLRRRHEHNRWILVGDDRLAPALREVLGDDRIVALAPDEPEALADALAEQIKSQSDRLILVGHGSGAAALVRCLHAHPGLRDRTLAVLGIGAALGGEAAAWLAEQFDHLSMDTEISRATPYLHLAFVSPGEDPPGDPGRPLAETRWPDPPTPPTGRRSIEAIDLGVLPGPEGDYPAALLARAILLTTTARLAIS